MSKFSFIIILVVFLTFATMLAGAFTNFGVTADVTSGVITTITWDVAGAGAALGFFFQILFFQVEGIPGWINLLVFWPLTVGLFFVLIELIVDIINAIIP